jgi:hypothetical protein
VGPVIRRLLVSFVAIATALAAGIALGGGPLSDIGRTPSQAAPPPEQPDVDPLAQASAAYADAFAGSVASSLYAGQLHGHPVALLTLPGADPDVVEALATEVRAAGTQVVATYGLKRALVEPGEKTLVDTLGLQLVEQLGAGVVTADATTYDRIGQLIGRSVAAEQPSTAMDAAKVASLRASLKGAGLMAVPEGDPNVAPMVLVVSGAEVEQPVLSGIVAGLAAVARGVVVAGPTGDASLGALRAEPPLRAVATVDGTDTATGRVATILTLVHTVTAPGGSYGASGTDGPAPLG